MLLALRTKAPSLLIRCQIPVQVILYALLFVIADRLVTALHLPLPANIVGMLMLLLLIAGGNAAVLRARGGRGSELRAVADDRRLENFSGDWHQHCADTRRNGVSCRSGLPAGTASGGEEGIP